MSDALLTRIAVAIEALVTIKSGVAGKTTGKSTPTQTPSTAATGKPATAPATGASKPATAPKATPAAGTKPATPTKPAAATPKTAATTTVPADGPARDTKDPNGKNTYGDVVEALKAVKNAQNKEAALAIMAKVGGVGAVRDLKPPLYDAVVAAATHALHPPKATSAGTVVVTDDLGEAVDTSGASAGTAEADEPPEGGSGEDL